MIRPRWFYYAFAGVRNVTAHMRNTYKGYEKVRNIILASYATEYHATDGIRRHPVIFNFVLYYVPELLSSPLRILLVFYYLLLSRRDLLFLPAQPPLPFLFSSFRSRRTF